MELFSDPPIRTEEQRELDSKTFPAELEAARQALEAELVRKNAQNTMG